MLYLRQPDRSKEQRVYHTWRVHLPRAGRFDVSQATAWFASLHPLLLDSDATLTAEFRSQEHELQLRITAPAAFEAALKGQLAAWFPGAGLEHVADDVTPSISVEQPLTVGSSEILPINLAVDGSTDPLLGVVGAMTETSIPCGLRVTCRREPQGWADWSRAALRALQAGQVITPRALPLWRQLLTELAEHVVGRPLSTSTQHPMPPGAREAAAEKAQAVVLEASVSVWAQDASEGDAKATTASLAALVTRAFRNAGGNALTIAGQMQRFTSEDAASETTAFTAFSVAELASLFHLPTSQHPLVSTSPARQVPLEPIYSIEQPVPASGAVVLGEAITREGARPFGLGIAERRMHLYVVGKTGTGKSTLLANLAKQDLEQGAGLALIDPHGDLAERVLALVPPHRAGDLLYFNAADTDFPVGFNLLASSSPSQRPLIASGVVGVFKKLYGESWGPRLEHFLRNAVLTLLESPSPSLLLLPRLLTDTPFRRRLLIRVRDPLLRSFFMQEYEQYDARFRAEAISPILNKVGQFLASPVVRHIVGQRGAGFDLRRLMDSRGIFIANLASGRIGEDNCDLLGGLLVAGFQLAAMSRANQREEERHDFQLLVDEFQHFANDAFSSILSEARKYRLSLTLSHQYLDQLPPGISDAIFGNVGSLCVFRVGAGDTVRLVRELAPSFDGQDLVHLPNHHFCARINRQGEPIPPFSARSLPPPREHSALSPLIERSRRRWARSRAEVELEIADLWEGRIDP